MSMEWVERTLSTGVKLCVSGLVTLHIGDSNSFMFTIAIEDVRQVAIGPRTPDGATGADSAWIVDVAYGGAHFSLICGSDDLAAVRYIFAGRPIVDMAERLGIPPATPKRN